MSHLTGLRIENVKDTRFARGDDKGVANRDSANPALAGQDYLSRIRERIEKLVVQQGPASESIVAM